jgi:hypothetical protein
VCVCVCVCVLHLALCVPVLVCPWGWFASGALLSLVWSSLISSPVFTSVEWAIIGFCVTLHPNSFAASLVCIVVFGMSGMSLLPVGMDLAVELTYPFPEGTSSGLLYIAGTLMTIVVGCLCVW